MKLTKLAFLISILLFFACEDNQQAGNDQNSNQNQIFVDSLDLPEQLGNINDFENILNEEQKTKLDKKITDFNEKTKVEFVIVTTDSLPKELLTIEEYAATIAEKWKVGKKKGKDNGLVLAYSKKLRSVNISTSKETQKILSDQRCQEIIDQDMIPHFKKDEIFEGLESGANKIIESWNNESQ